MVDQLNPGYEYWAS